MSSFLTRLASGRRAIPATGLGMTLKNPTAGGTVKAATISSTYMSPNMPMTMEWDAASAVEDYLSHTFVMRCLRVKADTIAGLPFRTGPDPDDPSTVTLGAPLSRLLGPASPQQPGGPNKTTTARALWAWSIIQYNVTGRMAWEQIRDPKTQEIYALYPLVSAALQPVPTSPGSPDWFSKFVYNTPLGVRPLTTDQVFYGWRPSAKDWRQAESILQAAALPISIARACDKYMWSLLKNGMVASKIIIAPPFEDDGDRRAWEEQFFSEFSGFDNAGKTIFAEAENDYDTSGKMVDQANVQVVDLSMNSVDAQLLEMVRQAKIDITIATGVPESLIGNASQRTYANADSEYRNYWTITVVPDITDLQDMVNINLAPLVGQDVGWFDLSRVVALQPATIFQPPAITDAINAGIISAEQASNLLNIPASSATGEDTDTSPIGEESSQTGAGGQRSSGYRSIRIHGQGSESQSAPEGWRFRYRPLTTHTLNEGNAGWGLVRDPRVKLTVSRKKSGHRAETPELANEITAKAHQIHRRRAMGARSVSKLKAAGLCVKAADTGRVFMLQRTNTDEKDPAKGKWEFPGGHIDPGEDSLDAAHREWREEVGTAVPPGRHAGSWTSANGVYRGHVHLVPNEVIETITSGKRKITNPDNPGRKYKEATAWFDPDDLPDNPSVRDEVRNSTDFGVIKAAQPIDQQGSKRSEELASDPAMERLGDALAEAFA